MSLSAWSGVYTSISVVGAADQLYVSIGVVGAADQLYVSIDVVGRRIALCLSLNRPNVYAKRFCGGKGRSRGSNLHFARALTWSW